MDGFVIAERGARVEGRVTSVDRGGKVKGRCAMAHRADPHAHLGRPDRPDSDRRVRAPGRGFASGRCGEGRRRRRASARSSARSPAAARARRSARESAAAPGRATCCSPAASRSALPSRNPHQLPAARAGDDYRTRVVRVGLRNPHHRGIMVCTNLTELPPGVPMTRDLQEIKQGLAQVRAALYLLEKLHRRVRDPQRQHSSHRRRQVLHRRLTTKSSPVRASAS